MDGRNLKCFRLGEFETNCYLVSDDMTRQALIIDAPDGIEGVFEFARRKSLTVEGILLTHGHIDHIQGLGGVAVPFYIHPGDVEFLWRPQLNLSFFMGMNFSLKRKPLLFPGSVSSVGGINFKVVHLPGHTPGSVGIVLGNWLFSGDTLFSGSIGRTDLPASSEELIKESLKKLLVFDDGVMVFPGHGPSTSIGEEKRNNPFLRQLLHSGI